MRRLTVLPLVALFLACGSASNTRPSNIAKPSVRVIQAAPIFFGSGTVAPVTLDVAITNHANVPIRVRQVEITSPGMGSYTLRRAQKLFSEVIPPGESRTLGIVAEAVASRARLNQTEPLSVRAIVEFEANGEHFREVVLQQFAGPN